MRGRNLSELAHDDIFYFDELFKKNGKSYHYQASLGGMSM